MSKKLFYFVLILNTIDSLRFTQRGNNTVQKNDAAIVDCVRAIGDTYFLQRQNVEIISREIARWFSYNTFNDFGIVVRNSYDLWYSDSRRTVTKYAVVILDRRDYDEGLKTLSPLRRFDPQGRFIVVMKNEFGPSDVKECFDRVTAYLTGIEKWNVVILMTGYSSSKSDEGVRVYTYNRFSLENCRKKAEIVDHGRCENTAALDRLFPQFINFHKCPIHLSTMQVLPYSVIYEINGEKHIRGVESNMMNLIAGKLNATLIISEARNGSVMRYEVRTRRCDISWGYMLQFSILGTTWSQSYLFVQTVIVIPQSTIMPAWMNLILPFTVKVWVTMGVLICLHLAAKLLILLIGRRFHIELILLGFFGIGVSKLPTRSYQRLYFISWTIGGYVIMQAYLASLTGFFISPGHYKGIQTLEELDKSNIVIGGLKVMRSQFAEMNPRIYRDWKVLSEAEYFENIVTLKTEMRGEATYALLNQVLNITHGQESHFIVIPEHVGFYPLAMLLQNSSLILEACNRVIERVFEAGLIQFWERSLSRETKTESSTGRIRDTDKQTSPIPLEIVLFILGLGYSISAVSFGSELVMAKMRK